MGAHHGVLHRWAITLIDFFLIAKQNSGSPGLSNRMDTILQFNCRKYTLLIIKEQINTGKNINIFNSAFPIFFDGSPKRPQERNYHGVPHIINRPDGREIKTNSIIKIVILICLISRAKHG